MAKFIYQTSGLGGSKFFRTQEELLNMFPQSGTNTTGRDELKGQPQIKGFLGPMYNGEITEKTANWYSIPFPVAFGTHIIRYETKELYSTFD